MTDTIAPTEWVEFTDEMREDYDEGYFAPLEFSDDGEKVLIYTHDMSTSRMALMRVCNNCGLVPLDWDAAESPCIARNN